MTKQDTTFRELEKHFDDFIDRLETLPLILATRFGPWLTPLVPAFFVHKAMVSRLEVPVLWAWIAAIALEIVGIAAMYSLLRAHQWNREKRKKDPAAPITWNIVTTSTYYLTALSLVLLIEFFPNVTKIIPAAFVILGGTSAGVLVLMGDQKRREREIKNEKRAKQERKTTGKGGATSPETSHNSRFFSPPLRVARQDWREMGAEILRDEPDISGAELGRRVGATERTGQNIKNELLNQNSTNGNGRRL